MVILSGGDDALQAIFGSGCITQYLYHPGTQVTHTIWLCYGAGMFSGRHALVSVDCAHDLRLPSLDQSGAVPERGPGSQDAVRLCLHLCYSPPSATTAK